jgi:hypothetical protein
MMSSTVSQSSHSGFASPVAAAVAEVAAPLPAGALSFFDDGAAAVVAVAQKRDAAVVGHTRAANAPVCRLLRRAMVAVVLPRVSMFGLHDVYSLVLN